jgi:hypothetical protein
MIGEFALNLLIHFEDVSLLLSFWRSKLYVCIESG